MELGVGGRSLCRVRSRRSLGVELRFGALFRLRAQPAAGAEYVNNVKEPI
jgi:hypothetical protein